jgi:hypothetical protein
VNVSINDHNLRSDRHKSAYSDRDSIPGDVIAVRAILMFSVEQYAGALEFPDARG